MNTQNQTPKATAGPLLNEIILNDAGNTYIGATANKFIGYSIRVFELCHSEKFHVFEAIDNILVHRASQSTLELAKSYCKTDGHILVYRDGDIKSVNESEKDDAKSGGVESRAKCISTVTPLKNGTNSALRVKTPPPSAFCNSNIQAQS